MQSPCVFAGGREESRYTILKRNHEITHNENHDLRDFLNTLRSRSDAEALDLIHRLRSEIDPALVLKQVREGELLLQASSRPLDSGGSLTAHSAPDPPAKRPSLHGQSLAKTKAWNEGESLGTKPDAEDVVLRKRKQAGSQSCAKDTLMLYDYISLLPRPLLRNIVQRIQMSKDPSSVITLLQTGNAAYEHSLTSLRDEATDAPLRSLDADALRHSRIQVPARPWTNVAGDGIVSHLVSIFFDREQPFMLPSLDEQAFVADMGSDSAVNANLCSPLLVNAICACSAVSLKPSPAFSFGH